MFSSCCDKDSSILFTTGRLPDVNPPWNWSGGINGCKCCRDQRLNSLSEARRSSRYKFWTPIRWVAFANVAWLPQSHAERSNRGAINPLLRRQTRLKRYKKLDPQQYPGGFIGWRRLNSILDPLGTTFRRLYLSSNVLRYTYHLLAKLGEWLPWSKDMRLKPVGRVWPVVGACGIRYRK
jgi:hypothetical protein